MKPHPTTDSVIQALEAMQTAAWDAPPPFHPCAQGDGFTTQFCQVAGESVINPSGTPFAFANGPVDHPQPTHPSQARRNPLKRFIEDVDRKVSYVTAAFAGKSTADKAASSAAATNADLYGSLQQRRAVPNDLMPRTESMESCCTLVSRRSSGDVLMPVPAPPLPTQHHGQGGENETMMIHPRKSRFGLPPRPRQPTTTTQQNIYHQHQHPVHHRVVMDGLSRSQESLNAMAVSHEMGDFGGHMAAASSETLICSESIHAMAAEETSAFVPCAHERGMGGVGNADEGHVAPARKKHRMTWASKEEAHGDEDASSMTSCDSEEDAGPSPRSVLRGEGKKHPVGDEGAENRCVARFQGRCLKLLCQMLPNAPRMPSQKAIEAELAVANRCLARQNLPGGLQYIPVHPGDALLPMAVQCGMPVIAVALGASYTQRLIAEHPALKAAATAAGWIRAAVGNGNVSARKAMERVDVGELPPTLECLPQTHDCMADTSLAFRSLPPPSDPGHPDASAARSLMIIYASCIYLGAKMADRPQYRGLLTALLSALLNKQVQQTEATSLEAMCLQKLDFRLGPHFQVTTAP